MAWRPDLPVRNPNNPVILRGGAGTDYESQVYDPALYCVEPGDSTKRLLFLSVMKSPVAVGLQQGGVWRVDPDNRYSSAGYTYLGLAIPVTAATWDADGVRLGCGYKTAGGTIVLPYTGGAAGGGTSIGIATSTTGLPGSFTKHASNPLLTPTGQGRNDGDNVSEPAFLTDGPGGPPKVVDGTYWVMYGYRNGGTILPGYRLATVSTDLATWTKTGSGDVLTTSPLLAEWHQWFFEGGLYWLLYESGGLEANATPYRLKVAVSGTHNGQYTTLPTGPVLIETGASGSWERYHVATGAVYDEAGSRFLVYCGTGGFAQPYYNNRWDVGVATYQNFGCGCGGNGRGGR